MNRRTKRASTAATAALVLLALAAPQAGADGPRHGLSAFGDLKYPAGFTHFPWVNPDAPKGGKLAMIGTAARTTFDSFNPFILKGDPAQGLGALFDSLMTPSLDEPETPAPPEPAPSFTSAGPRRVVLRLEIDVDTGALEVEVEGGTRVRVVRDGLSWRIEPEG